MLVVRMIDVPRSSRRVRRLSEGEAATSSLPLTRVTAVTAQKLGSTEEAAAWLKQASKDEEARARLLAEGVSLLNKAIHAHRAAAGDPYLADVGESAWITARIGYGSGDDVAEGRWKEAIELPRGGKSKRRATDVAPQGRVAAVLGGREQVDACEALILRARADLDNGRLREAALQLRVGVEAVLAQVSPTGAGEGQAEDLASLEAERQAVGAAANAALKGPLDEAGAGAVTEALRLAERVLRRRNLRNG